MHVRAVLSFSAPQDGQARPAIRAVPHPSQKRAASSFSLAQSGQVTQCGLRGVAAEWPMTAETSFAPRCVSTSALAALRNAS